MESPANLRADVGDLNANGLLGIDEVHGIAVDSAGNAYVSGWTNSNNFPITSGAFQTAIAGDSDPYTGFVTKVNSSGTALVYSAYLGGTADSTPDGIALDPSGDAYVTGYTSSPDFPITPGAFQATNKATGFKTQNGFVTKLNSNGTGLVYSTYLGGSTQDEPYGIAVDATGDAYITGATSSADFPATAGAYQTVNKTKTVTGTSDWTAFVTKMNPTGTGLIYSTYLGGSDVDMAFAIALDSSGSAYVTGNTNSLDFPTTPGAFQLNAIPQESNAFVTKLNSLGTGLVYSTYLGESSEIDAAGIAVDDSGSAYVTGITEGLNYPVTNGALQTQNTSLLQAFVFSTFFTKINNTGTNLIYSTYLSGSGFQIPDALPGPNDGAYGIALDPSDNVYLAGGAVSSDFPTTQGAFQRYGTLQDTGDDVYNSVPFVTKFNASEMKSLPATTTTVTASANPQDASDPVTFTATVKSTSGTTPTGTIGFSTSEGPYPSYMSPWTTITLDGSGSATYTLSTLPQGTDAVNAFYLGDANNAPSSGSMTETITGTNLELPVSITVTSSSNPAPSGIPVTFHISVQDPTGKGQPEGSIQPVLNYLAQYGSSPLDSSGNATWTTTLLPVGPDDIEFEFDPSNNDYGNQIADFTESITALGTATAPVISPASGIVYSSSQVVTITDSAPGQIIFYETLPEGSTVTPFSGDPFLLGDALYTGPITITQSQTVAAAAYESGYNWSPTVSTNYTLAPYGQAPAPTFSPPAGTYTSGQYVSVNDTVASAQIYYTTDGSQPTQSSSPYSSGIHVNSSETLKAIAIAAAYLPSNVASAAYVINLPAPDFSVSLNPAAMNVSPGGTATSTLTVSPLNGFNQTVSFACSGLPAGVSCSFSPSTINPGNSPTAALTITASSTASTHRTTPFPLLPVSALAFAVSWVGFKKRGLRYYVALSILLVCASMFVFEGCGGGGGGGGQGSQSSPTTSTFTVTATSGSLSHSTTVNLTVE